MLNKHRERENVCVCTHTKILSCKAHTMYTKMGKKQRKAYNLGRGGMICTISEEVHPYAIQWCLDLRTSLLTTILSYDQLQPYNFASTRDRSFHIQTEKGRGKRWEIQISNYRWQRGCFFVALLPQQLESVCQRRLGTASLLLLSVCVCV